jgi:hypothetical protein
MKRDDFNPAPAIRAQWEAEQAARKKAEQEDFDRALKAQQDRAAERALEEERKLSRVFSRAARAARG